MSMTPTQASFTTGSLSALDTQIELVSGHGFPSQGILVIDRVDANGTSMPSVREICEFEKLTPRVFKLTRGMGGTIPQAHHAGALVEYMQETKEGGEFWAITRQKTVAEWIGFWVGMERRLNGKKN